MNKLPIFLDNDQQSQLTKALEETFKPKTCMVCHEIESEYVHTDTLAMVTEEDEKVFATFGMSARMQNSPIEDFERIEITASVGNKVKSITSAEAMTICNDLCRISKYPFRRHNWIGMGHTMDVSQAVKETFGYDYYIFFGPVISVEVDSIGTVNYLQLVPIYEDEREWIVNHSTFAFLQAYFEKYDDLHLNIDEPREHFIPSEEYE